MLNHGYMPRKIVRFPFVNMRFAFVHSFFQIICISLFSLILLSVHDRMPAFIYFIWILLALPILIGAITTPFIGIWIYNNSVLLIPDIRTKRIKAENINSLVLIFKEYKNGKYAVTVKLLYKNGRIFKRDYSVTFRSRLNSIYEMIGRSIYTITKKRVDKICRDALSIDFCTVVNVIDVRGNTVYTNLEDKIGDISLS